MAKESRENWSVQSFSRCIFVTYHCAVPGANFLKIAGACLEAGIKDPGDFVGIDLNAVAEFRTLQPHER